jgi:hypothetical protein
MEEDGDSALGTEFRWIFGVARDGCLSCLDLAFVFLIYLPR